MKLKGQLQYERDFCNLMDSKGFHSERVASSGRRINSVCDAVLFKSGQAYLVEVKATREDKLRLGTEQKDKLLKVSQLHNIPALYAIRFKGKYKGNKPCWIVKRLSNNLQEINRHETWDTI